MNIRPANFINTLKIAEIHVETWRIAYKNILPEKYLAGLSVDTSRQTWENAIKLGTPEIWVAEHNGLIIGWIAFGPSRDDDASSVVGEIEAVYVTAEYWSCGFGKGLLDTAKKKTNISRIRTFNFMGIIGKQESPEFLYFLRVHCQRCDDEIYHYWRYAIEGNTLRGFAYVS